MSVQTITGVPPIDFLSVGQPLSAWSISGNSQQNGTPTPDAPIYPEFVGERTEQLASSYYATGSLTQYNAALFAEFDIKPNTEYTLSFDALQGTKLYSNEHIFTSSVSFVTDGSRCYVTRTTKSSIPSNQYISGRGWLLLKNSAAFQSNPQIANIMLNTGSTDEPYEPYGYKLPITISEQTTPIYLGQTQSLRKIKKLVLDGTEDWESAAASQGALRFYLQLENTQPSDLTIGIKSRCTHFPLTSTGNTYNVNNTYTISSDLKLFVRKETDTTLNGWKRWLSDQYSAGTPVTLWYVLADEETGIVNEPLCKIGDYADTVASTNTGAPSIPTSEGSNILTIGTTLQPSEVSITYMAPNTIAENLVRLQIARTNIATAITAKDGTLVEGAGFEDFPDAISNIPSESSGMSMAGITVLLYDGSTYGDAGPTTIIEEGSI